MSNLPSLSRLLDSDEKWNVLRDFDALMKGVDTRVQSANAFAETVNAARLLHDLARDHYYLFLVGQYKIKEIGRGAFAALDARNETVLFNLARAFIEHSAALAYQIVALEKAVSEIPKKPDFKNLDAVISRHREVTRKLYYNEKAGVHVNKMIEALTQFYPSAKHDYDDLCEFVHPNYGSNKLVSSGTLGAGQIRSHAAELTPELNRVYGIIEECAQLVGQDLSITATRFLGTIDSWTQIACQDRVKLSEVFSVRSATSGDGKSKETAFYFKKARTPYEAIKAFYMYIESKNIVMYDRRQQSIEDGFLFETVSTDKGTLWFKYRLLDLTQGDVPHQIPNDPRRVESGRLTVQKS